jgi:hypothetical protein
MARPVVWAMKRSSFVTDVVEAVTRPWVEQMTYEEGYAAEGNKFGEFIMKIGTPFCALVGSATDFVETLSGTTLLLQTTLTVLLAMSLGLTMTRRKISHGT